MVFVWRDAAGADALQYRVPPIRAVIVTPAAWYWLRPVLDDDRHQD